MAGEETTPAALAEAILGRALRVRRGENVIVESWSHTLPYATACVVEARRRGARPMLLYEDEAAYWRSVEAAPTVGRWAGVGAHEWAALGKTDVYVFFPGPADRPHLRSLPAPTVAQLTAYNSDWYRRAASAKLRGVRSVLGYASDPEAEQLGVSGAQWRADLVRATVGADMVQIPKDAERAARRLRAGTTLRVTAANGTDVSVKLRHRAPQVEDGVVSASDLKSGQNLTVSPPGTVVVAVDERSAEGIAIANRPSFPRGGRLEGGQWELNQGRVTNHWYTEGQATFDDAFQKAPRGRDVVSIFSIGLNASLAPGVPHVEDQEMGAVTLGIGGNTAYGGTNRCPFISWIVIGEATVAVDGQPLCDRGKLL